MEIHETKDLLPEIKKVAKGKDITGDFEIHYMEKEMPPIFIEGEEWEKVKKVKYFIKIHVGVNSLSCTLKEGGEIVEILIEDVIEVFDYEESEKIKS